jgi:general transcription factor 3C polypeptide 2
MLVAVCHDGTVAVWKVFPALSPLQETRPLLFFTADSQPLRAVAWVPDGSGSASKHLISTGGHSGYVRFWDLRDPFRPVFEFQISRACITNMDWLAQPRCMLVTMDDGTLRLFGLDNGGSNTPFTGKPYSGTQLQGLQSYFCSSFSLWAAQASRTLGTFFPPSLPPSACFIYQKHILLLVILWTPLMLSYDLLFHCIHGLLTVK